MPPVVRGIKGKMQIKANSPWKWVQLARGIRTKKPVQHHVLVVLVQYADLTGACFPSYERLMLDTGIKSKSTISDALKYLRDKLKIISWTPGHGNQFKHVHNRYRFDQGQLVTLLKKQKTNGDVPEEGDLPQNDESISSK